MSLEYDGERRYACKDGALIHEDTLPTDMSDADYGEWFGRSFVPGNVGCRMGPPVIRVKEQPNAAGSCTVPPTGWRCTREAGHEGPCAAVPV